MAFTKKLFNPPKNIIVQVVKTEPITDPLLLEIKEQVAGGCNSLENNDNAIKEKELSGK